MADVASQPADFMNLYVKIKMDNRCKQIRLCAIELLSELETYPDDLKIIDLVDLVSKYSESSIKLAKEVREGAPDEDTYKNKTEFEKKYITCISDFISKRERLLNRLLFENSSMDQIRAMYSRNINTEQDKVQ